MENLKLPWEYLKNRSQNELCDIYWNIVDNVWDRRIGRKPDGFDFLPDKSTRIRKKSKSECLKPYLQEIERLTTAKERRRYLIVVIQKRMKKSEFDEWWTSLERSCNGND